MHGVVFDVVCVEQVLLALADKLLELWTLNLFLAELTVVAFIDAALFFRLFLCLIFVAFLGYFVNELKSVIVSSSNVSILLCLIISREQPLA